MLLKVGTMRQRVKSLAKNKLRVAEMFEFSFDIKDKILGYGENAFYNKFLLFQQWIQMPIIAGPVWYV